jgi:hypothetical protein
LTEKKHTIIVDIDGTLCSNVYTDLKPRTKPFCDPNLFTVKRKMKEFKESKLYLNSNHIINRLFQTYRVLLLTGRSEEFRWITNYWLSNKGFFYDKMIMTSVDWAIYENYVSFKLHHIFQEKPILVIDDDEFILGIVDTFYYRRMKTVHITGPQDWNYTQINNSIKEGIELKESLKKRS